MPFKPLAGREALVIFFLIPALQSLRFPCTGLIIFNPFGIGCLSLSPFGVDGRPGGSTYMLFTRFSLSYPRTAVASLPCTGFIIFNPSGIGCSSLCLLQVSGRPGGSTYMLFTRFSFFLVYHATWISLLAQASTLICTANLRSFTSSTFISYTWFLMIGQCCTKYSALFSYEFSQLS